MTSLQKQWKNSDLGGTKQIIYIIRKILMRAIQNVLSLNLGNYVKSYWHFGQILAFLRCFLTKYGHVT